MCGRRQMAMAPPAMARRWQWQLRPGSRARRRCARRWKTCLRHWSKPVSQNNLSNIVVYIQRTIMNNPAPHLLTDSPSLRDVANAFREFVSCHGPAEIYYSGKVYDRSEDETLHFRGCIAVERVLPQQDQFLISLLDGFFPWIVAPVEPYSFEIVVKGASPS